MRLLNESLVRYMVRNGGAMEGLTNELRCIGWWVKSHLEECRAKKKIWCQFHVVYNEEMYLK